ncbi:MAG: type II toxin-antitoxin system RelE/ParE family toxin [Nitrospiraceae bacterium]|nr:type II toxin-antitoxin system RelE/ParE family toxin [Nitrospiraceae bacterium]
MPGKHKVHFLNKAARDADGLSTNEYERIMEGCPGLESDPSPDGKHVKKLRGYKDLYRLRIGAYRVVFQWKGEYVIVIRILTKQDFIKKF